MILQHQAQCMVYRKMKLLDLKGLLLWNHDGNMGKVFDPSTVTASQSDHSHT